ncbi:MAG TPA: hypothetical protein VFH22_05395 [Rhodocyclaceae bacterium]|nr:hypothetical protein [Rhodocyclaceae bacterium]
MCTFDAPISRCEVVREMVITDQTQRECAFEHGCAPGIKCPLGGFFTGVDFSPGLVPKRVERPRLRHAA